MSRRTSPRAGRPGIAIARLAVLALLVWLVIPGRKAQLQTDWTRVAREAAGFATRLLRDCPESLDGASRKRLDEALAVKGYEESAKAIAAALERVPGLLELAGKVSPLTSELAIPFDSAVLLAHRAGAGPPRLVWKRIDLAEERSVQLELPPGGAVFCVLELANAPSGNSQVEVRAGPDLLAVSIRAPPRFPLEVAAVDENETPTEAAVGLYSDQGRLLTPGSALDFSEAGYSYKPARYRDHANARYWPGRGLYSRCFFVQGGFKLYLPAGSYKLIASKGPEYIALESSVTVASTGRNLARLRLRRWTDMAARGWHSGDMHIHYARPDGDAGRRLLLWARAEGLEVGNILRMGDSRRTYFEQYAFGLKGRFIAGGNALAAGQEDPRSGVLGHTISLNLQAPVRYPRRYYLYGEVFEQARREGGVTGYAHVIDDGFQVHRDMTLNVPRGLVDFAEICEDGDVGTDLYYEFLNLGFRLAAAGGSDPPWGGTVGESRTYVYTGRPLDLDEWFEAVRRGRTFATAGPMLDLRVDGRMPGEVIECRKGASLSVHAQAAAGPTAVPLGPLEIVTNGEVVRSAAPRDQTAALDFEIRAEEGMWIAARAKGAHTTPVYVKVDGKRHWKASQARALIGKRLRTLTDIEWLLEPGSSFADKRAPENEDAFRQTGEDLRRAIRQAREHYLQLLKDAP